MDFHTLAQFMFTRQAEHYATDQAEIDRAWADPGVQSFWRNEAAAILGYIRRDEWAEDDGAQGMR